MHLEKGLNHLVEVIWRSQFEVRSFGKSLISRAFLPAPYTLPMKGISAPVCALLCALLIPALALSQDYLWHPRTSFSLAVDYSQLREENVNSNLFSGPGIGGALQRRQEGDFFYQIIEASGYAVVPKSAKERTTKSLMGTAALKYTFMLNRAFGSDHLSVGLFAKASVKESYFTRKGNSTLYWANYGGFGAAIVYQKPLSENYAFEAIFEMPLAGIAYRPMANGRKFPKNTIGNVIKSNTSDGNFAMPGNYLNPSLSLGILTSKQSLLRSVSYKYMHFEVKTAVSKKYWENNHSLTFGFKLGK